MTLLRASALRRASPPKRVSAKVRCFFRIGSFGRGAARRCVRRVVRLQPDDHSEVGREPAGRFEAGDTIDDFLEGFPSVTREHVIAFLEEAKNRLIESAT